MKHPWMPFYWNDFRMDTLDLECDEIGVYVILICLAWRRGDGSVPEDMAQLKRMLQRLIADFHGHTFNRIVPKLLAQYFEHRDGAYFQKRVVLELQKAHKLSAKQSQKAKKRWDKQQPGNSSFNKIDNAAAYAAAMPSQSQSHSVSKDTAQSAPDPVNEDPKAKLFRLGKTILVSFGVAEKRTGGLIGQWLKVRPDPDGLLAAIQFARDQNVAEPVAYISAVVHSKDKTNGKQSPGEKLRAIAAELRKREHGEGVAEQTDAFGSD